MSKQDVVIKGNKYGLTVVLDAEKDFAALKSCLAEKFAESAKFFGNALMAVSFRGRELSMDEERELVSLIEDNCRIKVACIADADGATENLMKEALQKSVSGDEAGDAEDVTDILEGNFTFSKPSQAVEKAALSAAAGDGASVHDGRFYKGTLRSGQVLESETSIIVLGDVNPGASLVSCGNVIILGALKGMVQAGAAGNENAFVAALSMHPMQIRIGDVIARSADGAEKTQSRRKKADDVPKIAFAEEGNIYIEPITKEVLNGLKI